MYASSTHEYTSERTACVVVPSLVALTHSHHPSDSPCSYNAFTSSIRLANIECWIPCNVYMACACHNTINCYLLHEIQCIGTPNCLYLSWTYGHPSLRRYALYEYSVFVQFQLSPFCTRCIPDLLAHVSHLVCLLASKQKPYIYERWVQPAGSKSS